jgi:hypothetical protein
MKRHRRMQRFDTADVKERTKDTGRHETAEL